MDEKKPAKPAVAEPLPVGDDAEAHPDYRGLTRGDVRKAQIKAQKRAEDLRYEAAMKLVEEIELKRLREEEGLTVGGPGGEMVDITLDMPVVAFGAKDTDAWIQVDGRRYRRGPHRVTRNQAAVLLHIASCMARNESARLGVDSFSFYQQRQNILVKNVGGDVKEVVRGAGGIN